MDDLRARRGSAPRGPAKSETPEERLLDQLARIPRHPVGDHIDDEELLFLREGTLSESKLERVFAHIDTCSDCAEEVSRVLDEQQTEASLAPVDAAHVFDGGPALWLCVQEADGRFELLTRGLEALLGTREIAPVVAAPNGAYYQQGALAAPVVPFPVRSPEVAKEKGVLLVDDAGTLTLQLPRLPEGARPNVSLVPLGAGVSSPVHRGLEAVGDGVAWTTRFSNVKPGEYLLAFEPTSTMPTL